MTRHLRMMTRLTLAGALAIALTGCAQPRTLLAVRTSGDNALARQDADRALEDAQEYVDRAPERIDGRVLLGRALLMNGRTDEACEQLWIARSLNTADDQNLDYLCQALYADGQQDDLYRVVRERIVDRGSVEDYFRLAHWAQRFGDMDEAQRALLTAARLDAGTTVAPQLRLARFHLDTGNPADAIQRYRMAYWIDPDDELVLTGIRDMGEIPGPTMPPAELQYRTEVDVYDDTPGN